MKKLLAVLVLSILFVHPVEAQWRACCQCTPRYYNPTWAYGEDLPYGYIDINAYPYRLPVNYTFNPRPCPQCRCQPQVHCPQQPECD